MNEEWERHVGILLQALPYLGHRILKIFTPDAGLLTLMAKHVKAKDAAHTMPFCRAEWVFRKTRSDIYPLKEAKLLDPLSSLREQYSTLMNAGSIASDLLRSQLPHRSAQLLYDLLLASLTHLPRNPAAIAQSFRLKLLQFEGMLSLRPTCMRCEEKASYLSRGESRCSRHSLPESIAFDDEEWQTMLVLGLGRRFSEFDHIDLPPHLTEKTASLFLERIHH